MNIHLTKMQARTISDMAQYAETNRESNDSPEIILTTNKGTSTLTLKIERRVDWRDEKYNVDTRRSTYPKKAYRKYAIDARGNCVNLDSDN